PGLSSIALAMGSGKYTAENQKIQQELELLRMRMQSHGDLSPMFALLVFMLSVLVGYLMTLE
ncbi:hypothetical protein, partial [Proteus mirabilis]|uniref:hypothetical protein n=1 Tax=Proteus mirabilis TaxID=584 RepID=UPI0019534FF4